MPAGLTEIVAEAASVLPEELLDRDARDRLAGYLEALVEANRRINLVSRQNTLLHLGRFTRECLFLAKLLREDLPRLGDPSPARLLDIGSGAGFPGMVLKLAVPRIEVTLVESTRKRASFLADVCEALDLGGIRVLWARAEALSNERSPAFSPEFRRHFHWVTAKALGTISETLRLAAPFLEERGLHWSFKGSRCEEEIHGSRKLLKQMGMEIHRVERIPGDEHSYLVSVRRSLPRSES